MWLLILFIMIPLIEIALFIQLGGLIGLWPTLAIVVLTAMLGTWLVRSQGAQAIAQLRGSINALHDPTEPLAHGAMILIAGALLLTPGFFTDSVGFAFLLPPVRRAVIRRAKRNIAVSRFEYGTPPPHQPPGREPRGDPGLRPRDDIIEGDFTEADTSREPGSRGNSGWTRH